MNIITFKAAHSHYNKRGFRTSKRLIHLIAVLTIMIAALAVSSVRRGYAADTGTWHGEYFTIADPMIPGATPILVREDAKIDFDWGANSPDSSIPTDNFSVRWSRTLTLAAGSYRFTTDTDDGVRLKIDGVTVLDHFVAQAPTTWQADVTLAAGEHAIVMEYFEGSGDASARLAYSLLPATLPPNTWKGECYATFTDDGLRLKVDGITVIDHFSPQSATAYVHDMPLAAGSHSIVMEYFEGYGDALANLNWAKHATDGVVRINAGGTGYADSFNNFWGPDALVTDTTPMTMTSSEEAQPIWNTSDDPLYINEHSTAFHYEIGRASCRERV